MLTPLLSTPLFAQARTSYYLYEEDPISLPDRSFRVYILPQLRAISQEYFHILRKLNPIHSDTINIFEILTDISHEMKDINKKCSDSAEDCQKLLKKNYTLARKLDRKITAAQSQYLGASNPDELLFISSLDKLSLQNYKLLHKIEEYNLTLQTSFGPYFLGHSEFHPTIHSMLLTSEFMLTQMLHGEMKNDFDAVWVGFFKEINQKLIYEHDKLYIIKRLEEMNLAWNTFHMKMTKGNYDIPDHLIKLIKVMHNRWNSCLKVILH